MREKVDELLKQDGAVLVRRRKHEIWKLSNGKTFVRAQTPSDAHADNNNLADLKRMLGISSNGFNEGVRREKKLKQPSVGYVPQYKKTVNPLADKLRLSGVAESALKERVKDLELQVEILESQNSAMSEMIALDCDCWFCKFKSKITNIYQFKLV